MSPSERHRIAAALSGRAETNTPAFLEWCNARGVDPGQTWNAAESMARLLIFFESPAADELALKHLGDEEARDEYVRARAAIE